MQYPLGEDTSIKERPQECTNNMSFCCLTVIHIIKWLARIKHMSMLCTAHAPNSTIKILVNKRFYLGTEMYVQRFHLSDLTSNDFVNVICKHGMSCRKINHVETIIPLGPKLWSNIYFIWIFNHEQRQELSAIWKDLIGCHLYWQVVKAILGSRPCS